MKRALKIIGIILLVLVLGVAGLFMSIFGGNATLADTDLPGGGKLVKDGYVAVAVLPAGEGQVALVDCGNDDKGAAILAELTRRNLTPAAVKAVFLTHGHPDHIAACHLFTGAEIMAFPADAPLASGAARAKGMLPSMMDTPMEKRTKVTRELKDGEVVTVGSLSVTAYATPGHTAGSASYLANGALYLGDNATGAADGHLKPAPTVFSDDPPQNRASLVALAKRLAADHADVKMLVFAHSGPFSSPDALTAYTGN